MFESGQTYGQFLNDYYSIGFKGYLKYTNLRNMGIGAQAVWAEMGFDPTDELAKAALLSSTSNYYASRFAAECTKDYAEYSELWSLLDKKSLLQVGDSYKYLGAHGLSVVAAAPDSADAIFSGVTMPAPGKIEKILSPYSGVELERSLANMLHEGLDSKAEGGTDWDWVRNEIAPGALASVTDKWLGGRDLAPAVDGVDTPAGKYIECIDRMISTKAESGVAGDWVTAVTAGDIFWDGVGTGTEKIDRSAATTWDSQLTLGGTATVDDSSVFALLEEIDNLMPDIMKTSKRKRYIIITTNETYAKLVDEVEPGLRTLPDQVKVKQTINGLSTYGGQDGGMDVGAIVSNGVRMPVFVSDMLPIANSIKTTDTSGHLYILELDHIYVRVDIPITYLETGFGSEMLHQDALRSRAALFTLQNLICDKFSCHGAIKWITA